MVKCVVRLNKEAGVQLLALVTTGRAAPVCTMTHALLSGQRDPK